MRLGDFYLLKCQGGLISILVPEVVIHAEVCLSAQLVTRFAVRDALDDSTLKSKQSTIKSDKLTACK